MDGFPHHLLSVDDLREPQVLDVLDRAADLKAERAQRLAAGESPVRTDISGRTVAMVFEKPSTRTRVSFQVAVYELGAQPLALSADELQLGRGETVADTGRVLSRYVHAVVVRTHAHARLEQLAESSDVPVVNALTDREHPCQALADLQTFREVHGGFDGGVIAYVGDGNNVAHSLMIAAAKVGLEFRMACPRTHMPDVSIVGRARQVAGATGGRVVVDEDPVEAVTGAHAVYTDVWTSMGQDESEERVRALEPYRVTTALMAHASEDAVFLHCLPAHRGEEVDAGVIDSPASRVFDQAENRLHTQKAVLAVLLGDR